MNPKTFAVWLQHQDRPTIEEDGYFWNQAGCRFLQSFPYHSCISPSDKQLNHLLVHGNYIGLRYSTDLNQPDGQISYHVVYEKSCMDLQNLPKKVRHDVRNGLNYASVEPIPFSRLALEGWKLRSETLERQGRCGAECKEGWEKLCFSAEGLPGFQAWGAFHENQLVASAISFTMDDTCSILYQQSATDHLKHGINNVLAYVMTNEALCRKGISKIFYGLHSLDAPSSVDEFKFRMGYVARPVRQRVVFHPALKPFFNPQSHWLIRKILGETGGNPTLAKAEGIIRFYLQGRLPLAEQNWPENLLDQKEQLLAKYVPDTNLSTNLSVQPAHTQ